MSYQHTEEDVEQCIKAEMKTLYPEEYERIFGLDTSYLEKDSVPEKLKTTIITVTYDNDLEYLKYNLKSIKKFCKGYYANVVVIDDHENDCDKTKAYLESIGQKYFIDSDAKFIKRGYVRQQYIKLKSDMYVPKGTDYILHIDSDSIFTKEHSPDVFFEKNKPILLKDSYKEMIKGMESKGENTTAIRRWQETTKKFTGLDVKYEYMRTMPLVYHTNIHKHTREYLENLHNKPLLDIFKDEWTMSEYNIIGAIAEVYYQDQIRFIDRMKELRNYQNYVAALRKLFGHFSSRQLGQPLRYVDIQNPENVITKLVNRETEQC